MIFVKYIYTKQTLTINYTKIVRWIGKVLGLVVFTSGLKNQYSDYFSVWRIDNRKPKPNFILTQNKLITKQCNQSSVCTE